MKMDEILTLTREEKGNVMAKSCEDHDCRDCPLGVVEGCKGMALGDKYGQTEEFFNAVMLALGEEEVSK